MYSTLKEQVRYKWMNVSTVKLSHFSSYESIWNLNLMRQSTARNKESLNSKLQTKRIDSEMNDAFKHAIHRLNFDLVLAPFFVSRLRKCINTAIK